MEPLFFAGIKQSASTIKQFSRVRYNVFCTKWKIITLGIAIGFAVASISFAQKYSWAAVGLMFLSCIVFANIDAAADYTANQVISMFHDSFPTLVYSFLSTCYHVYESEEQMEYGTIVRLVEDKDYLYIFHSAQYGIMLSTSSIQGQGGEDDFKAFISKKTSLKWEKQPRIFTFRISELCDRIQKSFLKR